MIWFTLLIFALHNIEEGMRIEAWASQNLPLKTAQKYTTKNFALAALLLWFAYFAIVLWNDFMNNKASQIAITLAISTLLANAIIHLIANLVLKKQMPGFLTALFMLPATTMFLWSTVSTPQFIGYLVIGFALQLPLAGGSLRLAQQVLKTNVP